MVLFFSSLFRRLVFFVPGTPLSDVETSEEHAEIKKIVVDSVIECMKKVEELNGAMVIISIEPGFSVCPKDPEQIAFREIMGSVNQRIANTAQEVYLSASGIQFRIR